MSFKVSFQGMEHSGLLEGYARKKMEKLDEFLKREKDPHSFEFHFKVHPNHLHSEVAIHLRAKKFDLNTRSELPDIYQALEEASDKMAGLIKKEKERDRDFYHKPLTEKRKFEA